MFLRLCLFPGRCSSLVWMSALLLLALRAHPEYATNPPETAEPAATARHVGFAAGDDCVIQPYPPASGHSLPSSNGYLALQAGDELSPYRTPAGPAGPRPTGGEPIVGAETCEPRFLRMPLQGASGLAELPDSLTSSARHLSLKAADQDSGAASIQSDSLTPKGLADVVTDTWQVIPRTHDPKLWDDLEEAVAAIMNGSPLSLDADFTVVGMAVLPDSKGTALELEFGLEAGGGDLPELWAGIFRALLAYLDIETLNAPHLTLGDNAGPSTAILAFRVPFGSSSMSFLQYLVSGSQDNTDILYSIAGRDPFRDLRPVLPAMGD